MTESPLDRRKVRRWLFIVLVSVFAFLTTFTYIIPVSLHKEHDAETMLVPLTLGHIQAARQQGIPFSQYVEDDALMRTVKREDPRVAFSGPRGRFIYEWIALQAPTLTLAYMPFVWAFGVSPMAIAVYSVFYGILAGLLMCALAWLMYDRWVGVLSGLFLHSSLCWLIHIKVSGMQWMPSLLLFLGIILCLTLFLKIKKWYLLLAGGVLFGFLYLVAWIGTILIFLLAVPLLMMPLKERRYRVILDCALFAGAAVASVVTISYVYAQYTGYSFWEIHLAVLDVFLARFRQGAVAGTQLDLLARLGFALRSLFWDMTPFDHFDKALEGRGAISWLFTACLVLGGIRCVKRHKREDLLLCTWVLGILALVSVVYMYSHRYALFVLPGMAIIAAVGLKDSVAFLLKKRPRWAILVVLILATAFGTTYLRTYRGYYVEYLENKQPNFEIDRMRGHLGFAKMLKDEYDPDETLVVMSDPTMCPFTCFVFNVFGEDYVFTYWSNIYANTPTPEQVLSWENSLPEKWKYVVYLFSTCLLQGANGQCVNDWRPFTYAHKDLQPVYVYSFANRSPLLIGYRVQLHD